MHPSARADFSVDRDEEMMEVDEMQLDPVEYFGRLPEVLEYIFKFLTRSELMMCSLVNSSWCIQARMTLRNYKKCVAYVDNKPDPCGELALLNGTVGRMKKPFFNGISVSIGENHSHEATILTDEELDTVMETMYAHLLKLPIKHFKLYWTQEQDSFPMACPAVRFVRRIFLRHAAMLKTLECGTLGNAGRRYLKSWLRSSIMFPKLEYISVIWDLLKIIVGRSPRLMQIEGAIDTKTAASLLSEDRLQLVTSFTANYWQSPEEQLFFRLLVASKPRLVSLQVLEPEVREGEQLPPEYHGQFVPMVKELILAGLKSLRRLEICGYELYRMFRSGDGESRLELMNAVTELALRLPECEVDIIENVLRGLQIPRCFPKLQCIELHYYICEPRCTVEIEGDQMLAVFERDQQLLEHSQASKMIIADEWRLTEYFERTFPLITCFDHLISDFSGDYFEGQGIIWKRFPLLTTVCFRPNPGGTSWFSLDSVFCGLNPEELEELERIPRVDRRRLQYAPEFPPITYSENLKELTVSFFQPNFGEEPHPHSQALVFSLLAYDLALERMPQLQITVKCGADSVGRHLAEMPRVRLTVLNEVLDFFD